MASCASILDRIYIVEGSLTSWGYKCTVALVNSALIDVSLDTIIRNTDCKDVVIFILLPREKGIVCILDNPTSFHIQQCQSPLH